MRAAPDIASSSLCVLLSAMILIKDTDINMYLTRDYVSRLAMRILQRDGRHVQPVSVYLTNCQEQRAPARGSNVGGMSHDLPRDDMTCGTSGVQCHRRYASEYWIQRRCEHSLHPSPQYEFGRDPILMEILSLS